MLGGAVTIPAQDRSSQAYVREKLSPLRPFLLSLPPQLGDPPRAFGLHSSGQPRLVRARVVPATGHPSSSRAPSARWNPCTRGTLPRLGQRRLPHGDTDQ